MFKQLWRYILALFAGSKEPRWERLDRLAETDPEKYQRELAKLSMKELNEYMDSVMTDVADRMQHGWDDLHPDVARGVKNSVMRGSAFTAPPGQTFVQQPATPDEAPTDYHWNPGQEHNEPATKPKRRRQRPGVFDRQAFNHKGRRQDEAVARRKKKTGGA